MEIFKTRAEVQDHLRELRSAGNTVGFVPTMGALHDGHLSLIDAAGLRADVVVCSIFVNPTQFNDKKDLENYPRPIESDIEKLKDSGCDVLFLPVVEEMYDSSEEWHIELGNLDNILEGEIRPGHYQGVTQIVKKLFDTVQPDFAFFGQKDFQQFVVISYMIKKLGMKLELVRCPIVRESDGLAMSSRNVYLKGDERMQALALYQSLKMAASQFGLKPMTEIRKEALDFLNSSPGVMPEYFEIYDAETFRPASVDSTKIVALVAVRIGKIRIIDNMILN